MAPTKKAPAKKKAAPKKVTAIPPPIIIQLQMLFSQTAGVNRWTPIHPVTRATIAETGGVSAVTDSAGSARIARAALPVGPHTFDVAPHTSQAAAGPAAPALGTGAATDPAFMFRPFSVTFEIDASGIAATAATIVLTAIPGVPPHSLIFSQTTTRLVIDWKPDWIKTANQVAATGKANTALVLHQTSTIERIGNHLNTFTTPNGNSPHYLVDTDGHVVKMVHESQIANHAGFSFWQGSSGVNAFSVGIEIVHNDASSPHDFTTEQYDALLRLLPLIRTASPAITRKGVAGHSDIATRDRVHFELGRKGGDPGTRLEWNRFEAAGIARRPVGITTLAPNTTVAGGPAFVLTINGTGFTSGASVQWAGTALASTFVSATRLTATVPANLIRAAGLFLVTVVSGGPATPGVNFSVTALGVTNTPAPQKIYGIIAGGTLAPGATAPPGAARTALLADITELQQDLSSIGYSINDADGVTITGIFDRALGQAVAVFQERHFSGTRRTAFTGRAGVLDFTTALAIKQVLADAGP